MAQLKMKDTTAERIRIFVGKPAPFELDGTAQVLMDLLANIEAETGVSFSLCGGFVRNSLLGLPYNDFDVCTPNNWVFRDMLSKMGLLVMAEEEFDIDGVRLHDMFKDPFSLTGRMYPIHWINHHDMNGFPPDTFDFSVNEFALKSDGLVYAPTYAWRHYKKKVLRANPIIAMTSNMIMRGIRFAAVTGYQLDDQTIARMKERFERPMDAFRIANGAKKILEDGVANEAYEIMKAVNFRDLADFDNIDELLFNANQAVERGEFQREGGDYHDLGDMHPNLARRRRQDEDGDDGDMHGDFDMHNDGPGW